MPRAQSTPEPDEKPYLPSTPRGGESKKPAEGKSPAKSSQSWTKEDKLKLLAAVLATAKPDFKMIANEVFGEQGRNANQVSTRLPSLWNLAPY